MKSMNAQKRISDPEITDTHRARDSGTAPRTSERNVVKRGLTGTGYEVWIKNGDAFKSRRIREANAVTVFCEDRM